MKNLKSILFALTILVASVGYANTDDSTPISGNYTGSLEAKTFIKSEHTPKSTSSKDYGVDFLFNGNVFIYQGLKAKAMGNYSVNGETISFTVNSVKGDEELINSIFGHTYKFSKAGGQLMLISDSNSEQDVHIVRLTRQK